MKTTPKLFQALAGLALTLIPASGGIIFSDNFDGTTANLNGATTDVGAGTWVAAACFDRNGDVNITNANAGSATIAFTPVNGLIYTLEASVSLSTGTDGDWVGFGFAKGQSSTSATSARFTTGSTPEGRLWIYARENTNNPRTERVGGVDNIPWVGFTQSPRNIDYRIVLNTTGGTGTWTATWFAKDSANPTYTEVRAATVLASEDINSVGFAVSGGLVTTSIHSFTLSDNTPPAPPELVSTNPADNATGVKPDANLIATFNKPIQLGASGDFTIKNLTTATDTVISLPGPDADGTISYLDNQLTIDPAAALGVPGDEIVIEISAGAIESTEAAAYGGLLATDNPNWSFTIDNIPPTPNYFHPIPGTAKAPLDGALFIAFNESVLKGTTGNLVVYKADNTPVETLPVTSGNVSVNGTRVTIIPTVPLAYATSYYVLVDTGAFTDELGNVYAGISNPATWTFTTIANDPSILFGDSFNRPNDTNLDASANGKYGSLGALNYTSRVIGLGNIQLSAGQLLVQANDGAGQPGGLVYINHNFTDAAISTGGGFSITVDLNAYITNGTGRYLSVGVGQSVAELDAQATSNATSSVGDLLVAYRSGTGNLEFFKNGVRDAAASTAGQPAPPTKMRIDYSLPDFNSGSTVNYSVFFDDSATAIASGTFIWSGTNENYISLSSNLFLDATAGSRNSLFDNLQIRTFGVGAPEGFAAWQSANSTIGGLDEDHDGDGVNNGVEYFIYGPVANSGFTALPPIDNTGGILNVIWTKANGYDGEYGTDFVVETSATLSGWAPVTPPTVEDPQPAGTVKITGNDVKYIFPAGTKNFARLKVTGP
jgi:hypothetical protein